MREVLARASERGIERVLAVCDARNLASAMTIERCGGVPEGIRDTDRGPVRRFWFSTRPLSRVE